MFGSTIRRKIVKLARAERARRLLHLGVELDQHRLHRPHDERAASRRAARRGSPSRVKARWTPTGELRPVERQQHEAGDDRRQRERQVDDAFTSDLPRKSSRTSTQAVIVPRTALISAAIAAIARVSFSAATASGFVTASQKPASRRASTTARRAPRSAARRRPRGRSRQSRARGPLRPSRSLYAG